MQKKKTMARQHWHERNQNLRWKEKKSLSRGGGEAIMEDNIVAERAEVHKVHSETKTGNTNGLQREMAPVIRFSWSTSLFQLRFLIYHEWNVLEVFFLFIGLVKQESLGSDKPLKIIRGLETVYRDLSAS